ncbi:MULTISPECIES: tetratricopeptide repeat protein [Shewanella]|uniref:Sel1 repeat family protein n=1 Tax=Shewanella holmiensis TaxID=2952222 RepID=A0A9X3AVD9_9GAMM|nr:MULTISPECIES: tetratricopeptide repeat protein [Shewanella]MCT7941313.1 sel1 repeat family protein [Shewanella holmiensis]MDP5148004.1 sel1 repeat family protein [Shewanella sp. ULN5]
MKIQLVISALAILLFPPLALSNPTSKMQNNITECQSQECTNRFLQYKRLSKAGHSDAMFMLGEFYYRGYGTIQNTNLALKWYRKAAKFDSPLAQYRAGLIYISDVDYQDTPKGIQYLEQADKNHMSAASHLLGLLYFEGIKVSQNTQTASEYFSHSYQLNYPETQKFITQNKSIKEFSTLSQSQIVSDNTSAPTNEMETIQVTSPTLEELFDYQVAFLENTLPDAAVSTGSRIAGRNCNELISCGTQMNRHRIQDFLMIMWF